MDRIRVQRHVLHVEAHAAHRLLAQRSLLRRPLERRVHVILDLVQVLHTLRRVDDHVRALRVRTEAPHLERMVLVPVILVREQLRALLQVRAIIYLASRESLCYFC